MNFSPFSYQAIPFKINFEKMALEHDQHDGDSIWITMDKGQYSYVCANCRLFGINTPEMNDTDPAVREKALAAKVFLRGLVEGRKLFVKSEKLDKYGRPLVVLWLHEGDFGDFSKSVNQMMIDAGHAVAQVY